MQIITLHKSKGLEYPLVFLPFVGIDGGAPNTASHCTVHVGGQRQLHWKLDKDEAWEAATAQREREQRAEDARLLYVGLTRAEHALWIAVGDLAGLGKTRPRRCWVTCRRCARSPMCTSMTVMHRPRCRSWRPKWKVSFQPCVH